MEIFKSDFRAYSNREYPVAGLHDGVPQVRSKMSHEENYCGAGTNGCGGSLRPREEFVSNFEAIYDCEQINDTINSGTWLERELIRLDNRTPETPPSKPGWVEGMLHPDRRAKYEGQQKEWAEHLHGQDLDPRLGHVRLSVPGMEAQLVYTQSDDGTLQASKLEYDARHQFGYDIEPGPEEIRHCSMLRSGSDLKFETLAVSDMGPEKIYQELHYDVSRGTITSIYGSGQQ